MALTPGALTYTADSYDLNRVGYIGAAQTPTYKDQIVLSRVAPKPTAVFSGVQRYSWKFVQTVNLTGALTPTADAIFEVNVSLPVGVSAGAITNLTDAFQAQVAEADFDTFMATTKITY